MEARARAGIELCGTMLRYAEVEGYGHREHHLLRLGSCDFDFDVTRALWGEEPEGEPSGGSGEGSAAPRDRQVATLGEALADVYESTAAEELCVAVHPPQGHSFFAPVPDGTAEADRRRRLRREAELLSRAGEGAAGEGAALEEAASPEEREEELHLDAREVYDEDGEDGHRRWFHVLALSGAVHARFRQVMEQLPLPAFRWTASTEGAARVAGALQRCREGEEPREEAPFEEAPFTLAVGRYPGYLELALARRGRFFHALHAPAATSADAAYFAAALLERLGVAPAAVGHVFAYGFKAEAPGSDFAPLGRLTGVPPEPLDIRPVVGLDPDRLAGDFESGPYVPCIGAALWARANGYAGDAL